MKRGFAGIPRQLAIGDAEFNQWAGKLVVMIDGTPITSICKGYDCEAGEATVYVLDIAGRHILVGGADRNPLTAVVRGSIEVAPL